MKNLKSNKFENNPFFLIDVDRFGYKGALREWIVKANLISRESLTNPADTCDCGGDIWHNATRPPLCFACYRVEMKRRASLV